MREGDGLDGRSTSFRDMDAMMNCKPTKRRSRDASQASVASQTGSSSSKGSYQSVKGVHTTAASHREDVHMEDHDATPVKDVASPHLVPNTPSIGKALDASRESLRRQQSRSPKKSLAGTNGHAEAGKLLHTNGTNAEATHRADVKDDLRPGSTSPAKSPTSGGIKGVVFEEPRIVKMEGEPTQPRPTTKPSQQAQHNELDDSDHRPKRLTEKFNRDDGSPRRHSIDPTDELQAEPNASRPSKQQRTDFQRRKAAGLAAQEKRKQNSKPGDGFDDEDLFDGDMKSLRQAGSRLRKPHTKFVEADKKPKAGYSVDGMIDGNTLHEHPGKIWVNHMTRSFDYQSPTGSAVIDPSNIVKAEWGVERHVRLLGSKTQHEQNLKHIVFGAKEDLQSFKADMLGFGMERNMQKSHLVYHDDE